MRSKKKLKIVPPLPGQQTLRSCLSHTTRDTKHWLCCSKIGKGCDPTQKRCMIGLAFTARLSTIPSSSTLRPSPNQTLCVSTRQMSSRYCFFDSKVETKKGKNRYPGVFVAFELLRRFVTALLRLAGSASPVLPLAPRPHHHPCTHIYRPRTACCHGHVHLCLPPTPKGTHTRAMNPTTYAATDDLLPAPACTSTLPLPSRRMIASNNLVGRGAYQRQPLPCLIWHVVAHDGTCLSRMA